MKAKPHDNWFDYQFTTPNIYGLDFDREWKKMRKLAKKIQERAEELKIKQDAL